MTYYDGLIHPPDQNNITINDHFQTPIYRSIWIHSDSISIDRLKYPTNFNSWSIDLKGALYVSRHFARKSHSMSIDFLHDYSRPSYWYLLQLYQVNVIDMWIDNVIVLVCN